MKGINILSFSILSMMSITVYAAQSAVNTETCIKLKGTKEPFILVLRHDQNLFDSIQQCLKDMKIPAASFSGVGALRNVTAGFYRLDDRKYHFKDFPGTYYPIGALDGNLTNNQDGSVFVHIHAVLADDQFAAAITGHLKNAVVADNAEIAITPLKQPVYRALDKESGLQFIVGK